MAHTDKPKRNNSLSIRLTESAVFLRTDGPSARRSAAPPDNRSSLLRGLLILDLVKPTKITSIEVELVATTSTAWPEGIGARRIDVTEEHRIFHATTTYFRPGKVHSKARRTASIGPGISYTQQYNHDILEYNGGEDIGNLDEVEWDDLRGQFPRLDEDIAGASPSGSRDISRSNSETHPRPSLAGLSSFNSSQVHPQLASTFRSFDQNDPSYPSTSNYSSTPHPLFAGTRPRTNRRGSVDGTQFQRMPLYETYHEVEEEILAQQLSPIPPYSPFPISPTVSAAGRESPISPVAAQFEGQNTAQGHAQSLEEFRNSLHASLRSSQIYQSQTNASGSAHSLSSSRPQDRSLSRHPSLAEVIPENRVFEGQTSRLQSPARGARTHTSSSVGAPSHRPEPVSQSRRHLDSPTHVEAEPSPRSSIQHQPQASGTEMGRKGSRFSLSAVSSILMNAVRSGSPQNIRSGESRERDTDRDRERSTDTYTSRRGRTMERSTAGIESTRTQVDEDGSRVRGSKDRGKGVISKFLKDKEKESKEKEKVEGWKEFKTGTYTYPISFTVPCNAPPTMQCDFGSVTWRLKANVHRPGAFTPKMTASRDVVIISCPTEEDTEDTENIIVERHWEQQLQYLISISGKSFYIGGTVPVTFTLLPLAKARIHRLSVWIEEKVDYYTKMRRIARSDPLTRFCLLSIKGEGKGADPILPLDSDSPEALRNSPLFAVVDANSTDTELSEIASSLMGPGPWTFHRDLQLPKSCDMLRFTNRNRRSNIIVSHMLKVIMRVERGDDLHVDKAGKRKLFDIVVQTPVLILSCRCNPEWTSLPRYAEVFDDSATITPSCPCQVTRARAQEHPPAFRPVSMSAALERITSRHSSDSSNASAAETSPVNSSTMRSLRHINNNDSILQSSNLFERLISGQESESGEAPPSYDVASSSRLPLSHTGIPSPVPVTHGTGVTVI